ncbi:acylglycerol lipase KNAG_0A06570 [Huiozyma naganishii CBS 8797]|uniref:Serine aminopeptidase S33 domain-containing protein n=1 Tax=Huiozyma naganishii (strain ATCC MYA-139 / BCRC 22969 / CBS 8797 / KCTC 17520 / NBRC 10181 / NCYC 3082 / Yp74L-3) TaxID=1071383 RepID=J7S2R2_HUIN7|nr:hypothetical protein KNAG_0A06570 [Kazachstania naganishii CBS 8797]CCK68314.1 hypothetical protein KNAG_0A06570 [Kazachstania naganishii CBS 8797]
MSKQTAYPYKVQTSVPELQYETFDGAKFAYLFWPAAGGVPAKARILLIHGFGEYTKIQHRLMDHLALAGYESFTFDQRGAGATSPGKLKGLTNEYYTFHDLEHFVSKNLAECQESHTPLFLWGHSMGGGICLNYACQGLHKNEIAGYATSGPLIVLHPHSQPNKATLVMSPLLAKMLPNVRIDTGLDLEGITSDPQYRAFLQNDKPMSVPLYGSFRQIYDFLERGKKLANGKTGYVSRNFPQDKPVLIQHGADDTINDPSASANFIKICPSKDKILKTYPGMRHSILSLETDSNFEDVFRDLEEWLDNHSEKPAATAA